MNWQNSWRSKAYAAAIMLLFVGFLFSCKTEAPEQRIISGIAKGYAHHDISLVEIEDSSQTRLLMDTAIIDSAGRFYLSAIISGEPFLQLHIDKGPEILLISDADLITVSLDKQTLPGYTIQGSLASTELKDFTQHTAKAKAAYDSSYAHWQRLVKQKLPDSLWQPQRQLFVRDSIALQQVIAGALNSMTSPLTVQYALAVADRTMPKMVSKNFRDNMAKKHHHNEWIVMDTIAYQPANDSIATQHADSIHKKRRANLK